MLRSPELDFYAPPCDFGAVRKQRVNAGREVMYAWRGDCAQTEFDLHTGARRTRRQPFCVGAQQRDGLRSSTHTSRHTHGDGARSTHGLPPVRHTSHSIGAYRTTIGNTNSRHNHNGSDDATFSRTKDSASDDGSSSSSSSNHAAQRRHDCARACHASNCESVHSSKKREMRAAGAIHGSSGAPRLFTSHRSSSPLWQGAGKDFGYPGNDRSAPTASAVYLHDSITLCRPRVVGDDQAAATKSRGDAETVMLAVTCNTAESRRRERWRTEANARKEAVSYADKSSMHAHHRSGTHDMLCPDRGARMDATTTTSAITGGDDSIDHSDTCDQGDMKRRSLCVPADMASILPDRPCFVVQTPEPALHGLSCLSAQQSAAAVAAMTQRLRAMPCESHTPTHSSATLTLGDLPTAELAFSLRPSYVVRMQQTHDRHAERARARATQSKRDTPSGGESATHLPSLPPKSRMDACAERSDDVFYCSETVTRDERMREECEWNANNVANNDCTKHTASRRRNELTKRLPMKAKATCVYSIRVRSQVTDGDLCMVRRGGVMHRGKPVHAIVY